MKDVMSEAGIVITPKNKNGIDQAIHHIVGVRYKQCMPDCWGAVKTRIASPAHRKTLVRALRRTRPKGRS